MTRDGAFLGMSQRLDSEQEIITCDGNGRMLLWDCDYPDPVQMIQDPSRTTIQAVTVSPSGRYVVSCGNDQLVKIFDLMEGGKLLTVGHGHSGYVMDIQWSPDEKQVVSVGDDCCVCVWNFYGAGE